MKRGAFLSVAEVSNLVEPIPEGTGMLSSEERTLLDEYGFLDETVRERDAAREWRVAKWRPCPPSDFFADWPLPPQWEGRLRR